MPETKEKINNNAAREHPAIWGDYHTHTMYSHGKGGIEDNVEAAVQAGLKEVAITDHGFRHCAYNVRRADFKYVKADIEAARAAYPSINILLGLETNMQGADGKIDINERDLEDLDLLICGWHKYVYPPDLKTWFSFYVPNHTANIFGVSDKRRMKNTEAFIKAINRYPIDIISHPKYGIDLDVVELAKEAKRVGTFLELNGKKISMSDEETLAIVETGVGIIVDSDAHSPYRVGDVSLPMQTIKRLGIKADNIVNLGKIPDFRLRKIKNAK